MSDPFTRVVVSRIVTLTEGFDFRLYRGVGSDVAERAGLSLVTDELFLPVQSSRHRVTV